MQLAAVLLSLAVLLPSVPAAFASQSAAEGTAVVFSESGITAADESGLSIDGTTLTIEQAGTYVLSGTCSDGSVKVKKGVTGVTLVLSGLDLTSSTTAPITCGKSSGVTILAAEGTENALTDAAANNGDNYPDNADAENAVIKCKDGSQVTIGGTGTLTVTANGKNGIKSGATTDEEGTAWLVIEDLTLTINAPVNDAVNAEASLTVKSGTITIDAGDDALHADYALAIGESGTAGPTITINSCYEGLAGANLLVASGAITIYSEDDCLNAANSDLTGYDFTMGITGGTIRAYAASDDGLDSNGSLTISGGTLTVWTANTADNQALDADGTITVSGGTVFAAGGSAGMGMTLSASQPYVTFGTQASQPGQGGRQQNGGNAPGGQPCSRRRPRRLLHRHQFLFLFGQQRIQLLAAVVRQLLEILLRLLQIVLRDLGGFLLLLERLHGVPADVADGHLAVLRVLVNLLHQFLAALLRQLGEAQPDAGAVVLGVDTQIGVLDGLFNALHRRLVPGGNQQCPGVGGRDGRNLLDGGGAAVVVHHDPVQHGGIGPARPHGGKVRGHGVDALLHLALINLVIFLQHK